MSLPATYKPSPLSIGSPRTSPFRRPESPSATSPTTSRASSPSTSPTKPYQTSPSKLHNSTISQWAPSPAPSSEATPRNLSQAPASTSSSTIAGRSPTANGSAPSAGTNATVTKDPAQRSALQHPNASLSALPPNLLTSLRTAFNTLDRSSTGTITRADLTTTLTELGLPSQPSDVAAFFPPGSSQTMPLAQFLSQMAGPLGSISREDELMNAFGAFDEKDSGEVDAALLRDALVHTGGNGGDAMSEREVDLVFKGFVGKKAFGKGAAGQGERGEVFRYREWVDEVVGKSKEEGRAAV